MTTKIEWTDAVWNPVTGCTRVSAGCDHCYAVRQSHRLESMNVKKYAGLTVLNKAGDRHFNGKVRTHDNVLEMPLRWKKPKRVFVNSMSDLFHRDVPFEFIDKVFAVMALCPQHTFQVLTKRPERMAEYLKSVVERSSNTPAFGCRSVPYEIGRINAFLANAGGHHYIDAPWPIPNVWLGTSVEDQPSADKRIPELLRCPAAVRFLSCEPLIGPLGQISLEGIHWVIVGGESGPKARSFNVEWARSIIKQCRNNDVPCFVKQLGSKPFTEGDVAEETWDAWLHLKDKKGGDWSEWPEDLRVREFPKMPAAAIGGVA